MANNPGAKKSIRKIARRTEVNKARRSRVRTYLRKFEETLTGGDLAAAKAAFIEAQSELMRAVSKGVVHKNTGSRKVSRLSASHCWTAGVTQACSKASPWAPSGQEGQSWSSWAAVSSAWSGAMQ